MTKRQKAVIIGICCLCAFGALIPVLVHVFSVSYSGNYGQTVTNTLAAVPSFAITSVSDSLGQTCTFTPTTASCPQASLTVGNSYTISVQVSNSGTGAGIVTATASTLSGGVIDSISPSNPSQNIGAGGSYIFVLTVTSQGAGGDTVSIAFAG